MYRNNPMAELKSLGEDTSSVKLSQEEIQMPLSPVLGTGQSLKKLLKNRRGRQKRDSDGVAQKFEKIIKPQDEIDNNSNCVQLENSVPISTGMLNEFEKSSPHIEAIPGSSKSRLSLDYSLHDLPENIFDRIQRLEELEAKKRDIIKAVSFSKLINADSKFTVISAEPSEQTDPLCIDNISKSNKKLCQKSIQEKPTDGFQNKFNNTVIHFQTGTGRHINIPETHLKMSAKLFDDILSPSDDNQSFRKKKFGYLSKSPEKYPKSKTLQNKVVSPKKCETVCKEGDAVEIPDRKSVESIFNDENFDDLNLFKKSAFKTASIHLIDGKTNKTDVGSVRNAPSTSLITKSAHKEPVKGAVTNIFKDCNFEDLKMVHDIGFQMASHLKDGQITKNSYMDQKEKPLPKALKNIFEGESFDDLKVPYNSGFQSALVKLKHGEILNSSVAKNDQPSSNSFKKKLKKNIFDGEDFNDLNFGDCIRFKSASASSRGNCTNAETQVIREPSGNIFGQDSVDHQTIKHRGFKRRLIMESDVQKPLAKAPFRNIFEGENFDDLTINIQGLKNSPRNLKSAIPLIANCDNKPKGFKNIFEGENFDDLNLGALGPRYKSPLTNLKRNLIENQGFQSPYQTPLKNMNQNTTNQGNNDFCGFNHEEREISLNISESNCDIVNIVENRFKIILLQKNPEKQLIILSEINNLSKKYYSDKQKLSIESKLANYSLRFCRKRKFSELDSDHNSPCQKDNVQGGDSNTSLQESFLKRPKKRLGCHVTPTIQISESVLKNAKLLFQDLEHAPTNTSTPIRFDRSLAAPLICDLTPVQGARKNLGGSFSDSMKQVRLDQTLVKNNARFTLNKPSEGDVKVWMENLSSERQLLEERLRMVDEKQTILSNQRTILEFSAKGKQRILPGVLYKSKSRGERICLKDLYIDRGPEGNSYINFLNQVNPQNSHLVHFYMENNRTSHIRTQDGAVIVPTPEGRIGISEIQHSFIVMEGVDPSLIPKGWIKNHYKWIVWKLASYERVFFDQLPGCFCVENIVQQLKYRYDIEIDKVKRSALHKIFERDDCPQRRLILCVSKIIKIINTYELELTDGWYSIRTVIDPLLSDQILKGKIKLGVKLITYGAELMNCDGCHPLEAVDQTYLKINYNSTRRVAWWSKLGCQKVSGPFLLPLNSINMEGGKIGCIKCFILRVYPVKYLEKCGDTNVWRNRKAEERREQEFFNKKIKALEKTNESHYSEYTKNNLKSKEMIGDIVKSIRNVDDPETLYNLLQTSNDPESIQENLSHSQKTLLYNYTINKSVQEKSKLRNEFNQNSGGLEERSVTPLLKIKIIDASCESATVYDFNVWRPHDIHMQEIKEGEVVTIFNVSCSPKWGLNCNRTTLFKKDQKPQDERYEKFRRKVTWIGKLQSFSVGNFSNEFDTVGIVVQKKVVDHQQAWMTDLKGNLLVIKIYDPPKNVLVMDAVNEGQIVTVCNLVFKHFSEEYSVAVADHFVVFSRYSQYKHLQEAAESLEMELGNRDLSALLQYCQSKIDKIESMWDSKSPKLGWDMDMDCSQITTTDLALLECVDKLI